MGLRQLQPQLQLLQRQPVGGVAVDLVGRAEDEGGRRRVAARGLEQVIVVELAERRAALVVDALIGQQEIVVKQFDGVQAARSLFGGATILGDGAPALILDVSSLL